MLRWCSFLRNRFNIVISFFLTLFLVASSGYAQSTAPGSVGEASPFPPTLESPEELASVQGLAAPQPAVVETTPTVVAPPVSAAPVTLEPSPSIIAATVQEVQPASSTETAPTVPTEPAVIPSSTTEQGGASNTNPSASADSPKFVDFQRDIVPLLSARCKECHSGGDAKGGLDITDRDSVLGYITPNSLADSSLWTDYLTADPNAEDSQVMPPKKPLARAELSLIRTWIEEGAEWPEGAKFDSEAAAPKAPPTSLFSRIWAFQGYFHPAVVHFPVALLIVAAMSLLMSFATGKRAEDFSVFCLVLGSLSACVAVAMGWSFAESRGYPGWTSSPAELEDQTIFWHRWLGVLLAISGLAVSLIAVLSKGRSSRWNTTWKVGVFALAALVAWVGHQGGELTYGEQLYHDAFEALMGPSGQEEK